MKKLSLDQVDLAGKRVFIRVDFNVPLDNGKVTDATRIERSAPTIKYAMQKGAKVIIASHMGRPKGEVKPGFSLRQVVDVVSRHLDTPVVFAEDCIGEKTQKLVETLGDGEVLLLENVRFHKQERDNDPGFAKKLAALADVYVNDAFGAAHRAHASTEGITRFVQPSVCGFLLKKEIDYFNKSMENPQRPLAAIWGGAKVSTKLAALEHLVDKCDIMLVGGGMAFTFLKAMGYEIGDNILETEMLKSAEKIMAKSREKKVKLYFPVDFVVADAIDENAKTDLATYQELTDGRLAPDIGPATIQLFRLAVKQARTIIWNGPMGVFEKPPFAKGTNAMIDTLVKSSALTVIGGGDSVLAVNMVGVGDKMDFMSTGGGAFLELMEGKELPGLAALTDSD